jgi:ABC-type transporter Mla MlaB component
MKHRLHHGVLYFDIPCDLKSTRVTEIFASFHVIQNSEEVKNTPWHSLELDLSGAKMIDSMGLNCLVHILKWAKQRNATARILIGDGNLDRLLRFTRMNEHADIVRA